MQIKTPVSFINGPTVSLVDADGQSILDVDPHNNLFEETKQAIVQAFEDAARWRFLGRAADYPGGPEELAMIDCGNEMADEESEGFPALTKIVDLARARLAAK